MPSPHVALVTNDDFPIPDPDLRPLTRALEAKRIMVSTPSWTDALVDWAKFDLAVIRSTWDYVDEIKRFRAWVEATAEVTALHNPAAVVLDNLDKHYLPTLAAAGLPVIATEVLKPGDALPEINSRHDVVVKPAIGNGGSGSQRIASDDRDAIIGHIASLHATGADVVIQPYAEGLEIEGEISLVYFDGLFSHAFRRPPQLARRGGPAQRGRAFATLAPCKANPAQLAVAEAVLAYVDTTLLQARVDLAPSDDGTPMVLELELTEPMLAVDLSPGAADRFADAVTRLL